MLKNLLILSSFMVLTACQSVHVKEKTPKENMVFDFFHTATEDDDRDGVDNLHDQCPNTPLNVVVDAKGCPIPISDKGCLSLPEFRVFYEKDSAFPKERYLSEIAKMAEELTQLPKSTITIEGHASKADKNPANISRERAIIIAQILKEKYGIAENRMSINFYGNQRPIAPNDTKERRAMNQRIYAMILNNSQ